VSVLLPAILSSVSNEESLTPDVICLEPRSFVSKASDPTLPAILPALPTSLSHPTLDYFSSGWTISYLSSAVITGLLILGFWLMPASRPEQVAKSVLPSEPSVVEPKAAYVGRITGMVDCKWEKEGLGIGDWGLGAGNRTRSVALGDSFRLASGLMEITYDTGAKVILQGPVTYSVDANGGYLAIGKLTGKLERRISNSQSLTPNPFMIRTSTATVTDLGTEFGVEVSKDGTTTSHVYRGLVRLQVVSRDEKADGKAMILNENESARVENRGNRGDQGQIVVIDSSVKPSGFVRRLPQRIVKTLNLVDAIAGGNGFGTANGRGIDPNTGKITSAQAVKPELVGDGRYHRVEGLSFVDGVFVPHGGAGAVQVDSAGHVFAGFPNTDNLSWGYIWAGGEIPRTPAGQAPASVLRGLNYSAPWHSLLSMSANKGITFDLEAVRRANPRCKILRFLAVAGNAMPRDDAPASCLADVWVFVDGQPRVRCERIAVQQEWKIAVQLDDQSRFLSLVATDGGDSFWGDQILFGDPRLVLAEDVNGEDKPEGN
jgi:hypothetical protein